MLSNSLFGEKKVCWILNRKSVTDTTTSIHQKPEWMLKDTQRTKKVILTPRKREEMERGRINEQSDAEDSSTT